MGRLQDMVRLPGPARGLPALATLALLATVTAAAPAAALQPTVPRVRDATAKRIIDVALKDLAARQRESGVFDDRTRRVVGGSGLPYLAFVALARAREEGQRPARASQTATIEEVVQTPTSTSTPATGGGPATGAGAGGDDEVPEDGTWRLTLARRTLARGSGSTVILRWPLAMTLGAHDEDVLVGMRGDLRARALTWGRLRAAGIAADRCYQDARCFNNYKIADALLNLELARSGLRGTARGTRLRDPARLRRSALRWLSGTLPRFAPATGRVAIPGRGTEIAAIISDPGTRPLAYAAMCTAWVVRATRLAGRSGPAGLRRLTRRALWGLLGATGPDGDISWSGRGQGQAWTHAASLYAAAAGAALFADSDPLLARRLRRLADIQLDALDARVRGGELAVLPSGNDELAGLDHYYSVTGSSGLALTFLQMARAELPGPDAPRLGIPAEIDGASFSDPSAAPSPGLATRRAGLSWMALRMRRDHVSDPRSDAGLVRAVRLLDGRWREQLPKRPGPAGGKGAHAPSGGPVLVLGGTHLQPRGGGLQELFSGVTVHGAWRSAQGRGVPGSWRYTGTAAGVALHSTCPLGAHLDLTVWLPRRGVLVRDGGLVQRAGYSVRVSPRPTVRALVTPYANSVQPGLRAYRIVVPCTGPFASATWSGGSASGG
mgnify:CR=1 FL=1